MKHNITNILLISILLCSCPSPEPVEDATLTTTELVKKHGYPVEEHHVTTPDGYILGIHRIPHRENANKTVYLQHGLLTSSADWVLPGPQNGLAFLLADAGYDVWMGNSRGNYYSRSHTTLNPHTDPEFWFFSWHEIGAIDNPATIDYILKTTRRNSLYYVGFSQGTTTYFVMTTTRPEYNSKIKAGFSLGPSVYFTHMVSPLTRVLAYFADFFYAVRKRLDIHEFGPHDEILAAVGKVLCGNDSNLQVLCVSFLFLLCGINPNGINRDALSAFFGHNPAGGSFRLFQHYAQMIKSGYFQQYDYGDNNMDIYESQKPPSYNLSLVTAQSYLFYSLNDWFVAVEDVSRLCDEIGDACKKILVEEDTFNHIDFLLGIRVRQLVYERVIAIMKELD